MVLETQTLTISMNVGPLPNNEFIMTNQPVQRPIALTTCTKDGKAATVKKRKASTSTPRRGRAGANKKQLAADGGDKGEDGTGVVNQRDMV